MSYGDASETYNPGELWTIRDVEPDKPWPEWTNADLLDDIRAERSLSTVPRSEP